MAGPPFDKYMRGPSSISRSDRGPGLGMTMKLKAPVKFNFEINEIQSSANDQTWEVSVSGSVASSPSRRKMIVAQLSARPPPMTRTVVFLKHIGQIRPFQGLSFCIWK